jgi:hypothetical protein
MMSYAVFGLIGCPKTHWGSGSQTCFSDRLKIAGSWRTTLLFFLPVV